jgi:hypothetical protein
MTNEKLILLLKQLDPKAEATVITTIIDGKIIDAYSCRVTGLNEDGEPGIAAVCDMDEEERA